MSKSTSLGRHSSVRFLIPRRLFPSQVLLMSFPKSRLQSLFPRNRWNVLPARWYNLPVNQLKRGEVIAHKGRLWVISSFTHHSQGRGGSHYKLELKDIQSGAKGLERFNAGSVLEGVDLEEKKLDFMYASEGLVHCIDPNSFEEFEFPANILEGGEKLTPFLLDQMQLRIRFHDGQPIRAHTPDRAVYTVMDTPPPASTVINESKNMSYKPAKLENGISVSVPEFVSINDKIIVTLQDQKYAGRASK